MKIDQMNCLVLLCHENELDPEKKKKNSLHFVAVTKGPA